MASDIILHPDEFRESKEVPPLLYSSKEELDEYARFYLFVESVILPNQPSSFVSRSGFHNELILRAVRPLTATAAPRGFLKSTTLARYRALHRLVDPLSRPELKGESPEVMILSETTTLAKEHLEWVKGELLNNAYLVKSYGNLVDLRNLTWNENEIKLVNGARCLALGYGSQVRGRHPSDIIVDDLESTQNMATEESLGKLKDWFYRVLMGAMKPETHMTVIGTIIARGSLLSELVLHEDFDGRIYRSLEDDGNGGYISLWPERYSVEHLLKLKRRYGVHRFNAEFQNEPLGLEDQIILTEWVRRHTSHELSQLTPVRRYIAVDPAFTEEKWGDYSAIIVLDELSNGKLYERLAWRKKVGLPELRDVIMSFYRHFSSECPTQLAIEEVAAQKAVRQTINELDPRIPIIPIRPDKDKVSRLVDVSRYFEMGIVSLMTESLINELLSFPIGVKDRVDALVMTLKLYEQNHGVVMDGSSVELSDMNKLPDVEQELYLERAMLGVPWYSLTSKEVNDYNESKAISAWLEQELW